MPWLRSILFALLFYPGTLVYVLTVIAVAPIGDRPVQAVVHAWSAFHNWLVRNIVRSALAPASRSTPMTP